MEFLDYKNLQHTRKYVILEYAFSGTRMIHLYEVEEGIEFVKLDFIYIRDQRPSPLQEKEVADRPRLSEKRARWVSDMSISFFLDSYRTPTLELIPSHEVYAPAVIMTLSVFGDLVEDHELYQEGTARMAELLSKGTSRTLPDL
ncbi:hypothetical protein ISS39_08095 [Candidatus Bathyarchaeota archaeon]|nr:hypothetical protein [Candidatus Bathyarchaeota archaeon]